MIENTIPRMNEPLTCRLMNVRIIGSGRLPKEDLQTIDDAIDALREAQVVVDERGAHTGWRDTILKVLDELMRRCREDNHALVYRDLVALRAAIEANTGCTL